MKLSQLVAYLNHLDTFDLSESKSALLRTLEPLAHVITHHDLQFDNYSQRINNCRSQIDFMLSAYLDVIKALKQEIQKNIEDIENHYMVNSYTLYDQAMRNDSNDLILNRRPNLPNETSNYIRGRMLRHSNWQYPGLILRPGLENWINDLVALDPLYLVDINLDLIQVGIDHFSPQYQRRVRKIIVTESMDQPMLLHGVPKNQIAFALVFNYFHYKPFEIIRKFLSEFYEILRPGGTLAFTFNNCDYAGAVELAERNYMCYTPGRLVIPAATMLGYHVAHTYQIDSAATWIELVKPGTLSSLRGGQALARPLPKR